MKGRCAEQLKYINCTYSGNAKGYITLVKNYLDVSVGISTGFGQITLGSLFTPTSKISSTSLADWVFELS